MRGDSSFLTKFFDGSDTRFIIPVYQRNYDWKRPNCIQLYDDLVQIIREQLPTHFFGSVVSVAQSRKGHVLIIDGQQRITTVSLLLLALCNLLKSGQIQTSNMSLAEKIYKEYLVDPYKNDEKKLISVKDDRAAYEKLFSSSDDEFDNTSNMTTNYRYFKDRILLGEITPDDLFYAIGKLEIINISLDSRYDNPQKIFESLNSTGLDLKEADKIRNFILMGIADSNIQNQYYEKYWYRYEKLTGDQVTKFIRDYLTFKLGRIPKFDQLYFDFKNYVQDALEKGQTLESILDDILKYAVLYQKIRTVNTGIIKVDRVLQRLSLLDLSTINCYLLELFNDFYNNTISLDSLVEILLVIESYLFRRSVCSVPTNALNKVFSSLHREVLKIDLSTNNYSEIVKYVLLSKTSSARFPNDNEFVQAIQERDFYSFSSKYRMYLFDRLENGDSVEGCQGSIAKKMEAGELSVEHIMPRHLSKIWADQLGSNCVEIHNEWINKIANLTITGYNSQYSDKPFIEKRDAPNGFKDSHLTLNIFISSCEKWGVEELQKRQQIMIDYFLKLWPLPSTTYKPQTPIMDIHSLDEDEDFYTGRTLQAFSIQGQRKERVSYWSDLFKKILKYLYQEDPTILKKLAMETEGVAGYFKTEKLSDGYYDIAPGLFVWISTSTAAKIWVLKQLFPMYGLDGSEFEVEILTNNDN